MCWQICTFAYMIISISTIKSLFVGYHNSLSVVYSTCKTPASTVKKTSRVIPQVPERILDAPEILDDYCEYCCWYELCWAETNLQCVHQFILIFFFLFNLMSLSRLFHSYRDEPIGRWGETGVSRENHLTHHMWPVRGSNLDQSQL